MAFYSCCCFLWKKLYCIDWKTYLINKQTEGGSKLSWGKGRVSWKNLFEKYVHILYVYIFIFLYIYIYYIYIKYIYTYIYCIYTYTYIYMYTYIYYIYTYTYIYIYVFIYLPWVNLPCSEITLNGSFFYILY